MRAALTLLLLACVVRAMPQTSGLDGPRPLVITEAVALPLSKAQIYAAAVDAWELSFGQEPGAKLTDRDTSNNRIEGVARVNYRSAQLGSRLGSMGVINYNITIQTENGQCQVRISHLSHTGNRNAPSGAIDLGTIYTGNRPEEPVPGVSKGSAERLHADMRAQATAHIGDVMKRFSSAMRRAAGPMR